jgi:hypothetical protein
LEGDEGWVVGNRKDNRFGSRSWREIKKKKDVGRSCSDATIHDRTCE